MVVFRVWGVGFGVEVWGFWGLGIRDMRGSGYGSGRDGSEADDVTDGAHHWHAHDPDLPGKSFTHTPEALHDFA